MPKKLSSALGIDIGSQQIKLAEVKMQGREPAVTAIAIAPTPEGAVDHTGVYDADGVSAVIKQMIATSGASVSNIVLSIAGQASVLVRTLEVPRMSPAELKEHMEWEISRNIPFAESTIVSDFKAFENADPNSANLDVVMAIAPQSAVDLMVNIVTKLGRKPVAIDCEPLSLARSQVTSYGSITTGQTVCIVDIGHSSTSINMYRDGQLLMPRMVPIGGYQFTKAIADNLGMAEPDAEAMKQRISIPESAGLMPTFDPFGGAGAFDSFNPFPIGGAADPMLGGATIPPASGYNPYGDAVPPAADPGFQAYNPGAMDTDFTPYNADAAAGTGETTIPPTDAAPYGVTDPYAADATVDPNVTQAVPAAFTPAAPPASSGSDSDNQAYNAMAAVLDEFVSELRRSIDYFRSKGGDVNVIYLAGGGGKLGGLGAFISRNISLNVESYDPLRSLNLAAKRLEPGVVENHRQEFAVAVGNALHICFD
jgi:type IV pilus assembly protein PilM